MIRAKYSAVQVEHNGFGVMAYKEHAVFLNHSTAAPESAPLMSKVGPLQSYISIKKYSLTSQKETCTEKNGS